MNSKWYFSALVVVLALLGINLEQSVAPNQEIVFEFSHAEVTSVEAQKAIANVTNQLEEIGADQIRVLGAADGRLKITYYSQQDVASVKKILAVENAISRDYAVLPPYEGAPKDSGSRDASPYEFNISEIQDGPSIESDFNGFVLEFTTLQDRYVSPDVFFAFSNEAIKIKANLEHVAYTFHSINVLDIDNSSHNIPEVRAGPRV